MAKKKKNKKESDNLSIKASFDDVIGVTVGVLPQEKRQEPKEPKKIIKKDK